MPNRCIHGKIYFCTSEVLFLNSSTALAIAGHYVQLSLAKFFMLYKMPSKGLEGTEPFVIMKHSIRVGFSFGLTSGIITTLGLMVGLHSGTHSKLVVLGGILTIAIADAFSDALGIHMSEESEHRHTEKEIWESTISTFFSKLVFALTFIIPVLVFELSTAVVISIIWGLSVLSIVSFSIAKEQKSKPWKVVAEHLIIALVVIVITHYVGDWISSTFC